MLKYIIIGSVVLFIAILIFVMSLVLSLVKKNKEWFNKKPQIQFTTKEIDKKQMFNVNQPGKYVFCVTVKRDLKLTRPPLRKINLVVSNDDNRTLDLSQGLFVYKKITGKNLKEINYVLAEFTIEKPGNYYIEVVGDKGTYLTDKFFIRPKLRLF